MKRSIDWYPSNELFFIRSWTLNSSSIAKKPKLLYRGVGVITISSLSSLICEIVLFRLFYSFVLSFFLRYFFQLIFCRIELQVERAFFLLARLLPQVLNSYTSLDRDDGDGRKKNCNGTNAQPRSSTASELELENLKMQSISVEFQKRKQPRKQKMTLALIKTFKNETSGS